MITEWGGKTYATVPGKGRVEMEDLTPDDAMLVLIEIEKLMLRLAADAETIRQLALKQALG